MWRNGPQHADVEHPKTKVATKSNRDAWLYLGSSSIQLVLEVTFVIFQLNLFGLSVPQISKCRNRLCMYNESAVDCFTSRPVEKTIFLNTMLICSFICIFISVLETKSILLIRFIATKSRITSSYGHPGQNLYQESPQISAKHRRPRNLILNDKDEYSLQPSDKYCSGSAESSAHGSIYKKKRRKGSPNFWGRNRHFSAILESECAESLSSLGGGQSNSSYSDARVDDTLVLQHERMSLEEDPKLYSGTDSSGWGVMHV